MIFHPTRLEGAWLVAVEKHNDERGFFARTWCRREFEAAGLDSQLAQASISFNEAKGTLRGMHYQLPPHEEVKLVRCTRGALYDVIIDLRPRSPTHLRWQGFELTADNRLALYIPKGFAHGFQTLLDATEVFYQISTFYAPGSAGGIRFDDPAFGIDWPLPVSRIAERDAGWPDFTVTV